jgi:hypothetical protein
MKEIRFIPNIFSLSFGMAMGALDESEAFSLPTRGTML